MLELVKSCCGDQQCPDLYKSSNSYLIFLCILAKILKKAMETSEMHFWKQMKGRYSNVLTCHMSHNSDHLRFSTYEA